MTRDKFDKLIKDIVFFWREEFIPYQNARIFCLESRRFLVEEVAYRHLPFGIAVEIITECHDYRAYTPPKSTISDHLKDCFGWATC